MNRLITNIVTLVTILALGFTSCKSGDDDDFEPISPEDKALVSTDIPAEGWSGDSENGVLRYASDEYDPEEANSYFAFRMKGGVCEKAVLNIVMENSAQASHLAQMLNNGTWVNYDDDDDCDDDDDDDYDYYNHAAGSRAYDMTAAVIKRIKRISVSRSDMTLPIPVQQDGKIIYILIPNMQGLSADDLKTVMSLWDGDSSVIPDHVIFGTYKDGVYVCKNMHGMNIDYVIETRFNSSGFCTQYTTSVTLPTEGWAGLYYDMYEDQLRDFENMFGMRPDLRIEGRTVTLDAIILGDVTESEVNSMIYAIDWLNNCPLAYRLF